MQKFCFNVRGNIGIGKFPFLDGIEMIDALMHVNDSAASGIIVGQAINEYFIDFYRAYVSRPFPVRTSIIGRSLQDGWSVNETHPARAIQREVSYDLFGSGSAGLGFASSALHQVRPILPGQPSRR